MELKQTFEMLWAAQEELGSVWILPDAEASLNFDLTEFGEVYREILLILAQEGFGKVVDGHMRLDQRYFRNNARQIDLNREMCDVLMMFVKYFMNVSNIDAVLENFSEYTLGHDEAFDINEIYRSQFSTLQVLVSRKDIDTWQSLDSIVYAFTCLYSILPEGYFHQAMVEKMNKYRAKIAALKESK